MSGWQSIGELAKRLVKKAEQKQDDNDGSSSQH